MAKLSTRRLEAIIEALTSRLAGDAKAEFGPDFEITRKDYEGAQEWAEDQLDKRAARKAAGS